MFLYVKANPFSGMEEGLKVKWSIELTDFELSRFYCTNNEYDSNFKACTDLSL